ncbi:MAG: flagellar motor switch protein FliM [Gammaproteobacteria bacterium]
MSLNDVLNQDEIDALLNGGKGDDSKKTEEVDPSKPRSFDFTKNERIVRGRMPTLEMINERFARNMRISLFGLLRRNAEISVQGIRVVKFGEYVHSLFVPTSLNLVRIRPLRGSALFILDAKFVYILVDNFFGGEGKFHNKIEGRDFTPTEYRIIQLILNMSFNDLKEAWHPIMPVEFSYQSSEVNPSMANIVSPTEIVVVSRFRIELEGGGGEMHVTIPYTMLEPIKDILDSGLQSDRNETDENWLSNLHEEIFDADLDIKSVILKKELGLKQVKDLKAGDIIPVELPEHGIMYADGVPTFSIKLGKVEDKYGLKIIDTLIKKRPITELSLVEPKK